MAKYVAVGVLAVIVLAAVTYESPKSEPAPEGVAAKQVLQGTYGGDAPPDQRPVEAPVAPPADGTKGETAAIPLPGVEAEAAPPPAELEYTVKQGQTLMGIAKELLGSAARWKELYERNQERIPDPNQITAGTKLLFSPEQPTDARSPKATTLPASFPGKDHEEVDEAPATASADARTYTVGKGETLYSIAKSELGKGSRWAEIVELNELPNEHVAAGTVLQMPAR